MGYGSAKRPLGSAVDRNDGSEDGHKDVRQGTRLADKLPFVAPLPWRYRGAAGLTSSIPVIEMHHEQLAAAAVAI